MLQIRKSNERGLTQAEWLKSYHTFSFGDYFDPLYHHFRELRVINEDWIRPGQGFESHSHQDMEIITYVMEGALRHRDSLGNESVIRPHEVQRMSAGTGVMHSEFNASDTEEVHLLQIWILPEKKGLHPGYEQKFFPREDKMNRWKLLASPDARNGSVTIHQQAELYASLLDPGASIEHSFNHGHHGWLQLAKGRARLNGILLNAGDGAALSGESRAGLIAETLTEALLFDLA